MSNVNSALFLVEMGFHVFPICENTKFPLKGSHGFKDASQNRQLVSMWWKDKNHNIGVATEKFGDNEALIVVDIDCKNGGQGFVSLEKLIADGWEFPKTLKQLTPSGGMHLIYKFPRAVFQGRASLIAPGIDIRSRGGYILMSDSSIDGKDYELELAGIADAPQCLVDFLDNAEAASRPKKGAGIMSLVSDVDQVAAMSDAVSYLLQLEPAQMGQLDDMGFRAACVLRDLGCTYETTIDAIKRFWKYDGVLSIGHVEKFVDSAFKYAQNDPGVAARGTMFDDLGGENTETAQKVPDSKPKSKLFLEWNENCVPFIGKPALIEDLLPIGGSSLLWGKPNTGKTFLALDMAFKIATGTQWFGRDVEPGFVVYIAAEAGQSIRNRIHAFNQKFGVVGKRIPFAVIPCQIDLYRPSADIKPLIDLIASTGQKPSLIILDTLARIMAGGNENDAADMGMLVNHAGALTTSFGSHVMFVHHANKTGDIRGSTALECGIDTDIEVTEKSVMKIGKNREFARDSRPIPFSLEVVDVGVSPKGKRITSCVINEAPTMLDMDGLPEEVHKAFEVLAQVMVEKAEIAPARWGLGNVYFINLIDWRRAFMAEHMGDKNENAQKKAWGRVREQLENLPPKFRFNSEEEIIIKV